MAKKKTKPSDNIHDKFFKEIYSRKEIMANLIEEVFPENLRNKLNINTLELENNSFTGEELEEYFSDLIYSCEYEGKQSVRISLLLEHKSYVEDFPHFQLNQYLLNIWKEDIKQKKQPTLTIPIVIYHGSRKWKKRPISSYFATTDEVLETFIPSFDYLLFDISHYSDEQISNFKDKFFALSSLLLKYSRTKKYLDLLVNNFGNILAAVLEYETNNIAIPLFVYLSITSDVSKAEMTEALDKVSPKNKNKTMTLYDRLIDEGIEKGMEKGIEKGMEKGVEKTHVEGVTNLHKRGMNETFIAEIFNLSVQKVKEILASQK